MDPRSFPTFRLLVFALLSLLDLIETWLLLNPSGGRFRIVEGNPVAAAWLNRFGWKGLVVFKASAMVLLAVVAVLIWLHRPRFGRWVLTLACLLVGLVALYSYRLLRLYG